MEWEFIRQSNPNITHTTHAQINFQRKNHSNLVSLCERHRPPYAPMANPNHGDISPSWGTWEELLLAFAVNRHGTAAWDSIAAELRKRISDRVLCITPQICRHKYLDLKRRFISSNEDFEDDDADDGKSNVQETMPLLEELRKLRVSELRREVQRYDLNIESLELKMRNMEEEREKTSRSKKTDSDLDKDGNEGRADELSPVTAPEPTAGEPSIREDMEKDQMSVNESNSTDPLVDKSRSGEKETKPEERTGRKSDEPIRLISEPDRKSDSCNGSSNSIDVSEHKAKAESMSRSADQAESVGGRDEATKENSDVQSSASKSRKEGGNDKVLRGRTSGDERELEDQSHAAKDFSAESQPLMEFLRAIRAHKLGSVFERRLRSQENPNYIKMIMQHMDLETVEARLKEGFYSASNYKFFRDLLLMVNNALVFFPKKSPESNAASEIRIIVSKEICQKHSKSESSSGRQLSLQSLSATKKEEAEPSNPLMLKPRISGSLIVCRKRSSIAGKDRKIDRSVLLSEESMDDKPRPPKPEDPKITKKRTRDGFPTASKKNAKSHQAPTDRNSSLESGKPHGKAGSSSSHQAEDKKRQPQAALESKKRGAANFLNRMKQTSSPTNNGALLDALKNTPLTSDSNGGSEGKKNNENAKRCDKNSRRSSETNEKASPAKRNVGRPPKRGGAPPQPSSIGKRGRERENESASPSMKQPKKRSRKLRDA